ncbi:hypothetical protein EVAR_41764_1 [Eumeta japonica]|uniref:Uncharacterized protein n=1 Tax=Eumeta variegata TaxID=151549 RepID=A0A4C1VY03_EUMVA|nr:hypothetical protein EVAR_41764_1 [Eumeta japonica]
MSFPSTYTEVCRGTSTRFQQLAIISDGTRALVCGVAFNPRASRHVKWPITKMAPRNVLKIQSGTLADTSAGGRSARRARRPRSDVVLYCCLPYKCAFWRETVRR